MELIITSIIAFASTNIDDLFILMVFFSNKEYPNKAVVIGQYIGIIVLIAISFIGSLFALFIDQPYIGLLGIMPVFFGIRGVVQLTKHNDSKQNEKGVNVKQSGNILSVASLTISNGVDNISIYTPLFASFLIEERIFMIAVFLLMVAVWCYGALYLSKHSAIANTIGKYGHIITPIVLILLGLYIMYESGSFTLLQ